MTSDLPGIVLRRGTKARARALGISKEAERRRNEAAHRFAFATWQSVWCANVNTAAPPTLRHEDIEDPGYDH